MANYFGLFLIVLLGVASANQEYLVKYDGCTLETDLDLQLYSALLEEVGDEEQSLYAYCSHQRFLLMDDPSMSYFPYINSYLESVNQLSKHYSDISSYNYLAASIAMNIAWGIDHGFKFFDPMEFFVESMNDYLVVPPFHQAFYSDRSSLIYYYMVDRYSEVLSNENFEDIYKLTCANGDVPLARLMLDLEKVEVDVILSSLHNNEDLGEYSIVDGDTCLIAAIRNRHSILAIELLERGAEVLKKNSLFETASSLYEESDIRDGDLDFYFYK